MRNFGILALLLGGAITIQATELPDLTGIQLRGSYAFAEPQLALELYRILPGNEPPNVRSSGFVSCRAHGRGITAWVDCSLKTIVKGSSHLGGSISLESTAPKILRVRVSDPQLFLHARQTSEQVTCRAEASPEGSKIQICDLRLE